MASLLRWARIALARWVGRAITRCVPGVHPLEHACAVCQARAMTLIRPRRGNGRVIAGVCAAIADRFQWNRTTVRVLTVASIILPGPQVIVYLICWLVIPREV